MYDTYASHGGVLGYHTIEVGFGGLTGRPFAFTGARVPALSAFLCSRWICTTVSLGLLSQA